MANKEYINVGSQSNDGTGDSIRDAFSKVNTNFDTLFNVAGLGNGLRIKGGFSDGPTGYNTQSVLLTDALGTTVTQATIVGGTGIGINYDFAAGTITLTNNRSSLSSDPNPTLSANLSGNYTYRAVDFANPAADQDLVTRRWIYDNFLNRDSNYVYESGIPPTTSTVFGGSTLRQNISLLTTATSSTHLVNKAYADGKVSLAGISAIDPATGSTNTSFGQMTGALQLFRNPNSGDSYLTAATMGYVDNNTYWSDNNIYVNTKGSDYQPTVPSGRRGRNSQYAFATINKAARYAEALQNAAKIEVGDYARLITYANGQAATVSSTVNNYGGSKLTQLNLNVGTVGSDQFGSVSPGNYTIFPGQYIQGVESGALALIENIAKSSFSGAPEVYTIQYVDYAIGFNTDIIASNPLNSGTVAFTFVSLETAPIPDFWVGYQFYTDTGVPNGTIVSVQSTADFQGNYHDSFVVEFTSGAPTSGTISNGTWHVYSGDLQANEQVVYNTNVSSYQISLILESGEYYEQYPIKLPPNTSIRGDEFRRCIIRPAYGASGSKWANTYFKRDTQIDGLQIAALNSGTNYASTGSIANASVSLTGSNGSITVAVSTGTVSSTLTNFMFVGNGGQGVITAVNGSSFSVTVDNNGLTSASSIPAGSWAIYKPYNFGYHYLRDPSRPINVGNTQTNYGGYASAAALLTENRQFIQAQTVAYVNAITSGTNFQYNQVLCYRDAGLIVDSLVYDLTYGGYGQSTVAGDSYANVTAVQSGELTTTTAAIAFIGTLSQQIIQNQSVTLYQNTVTQTIDTTYTAESGSGVVLADMVNVINKILNKEADLNLPKLNSEMDVFLMNDATMVRYVSCQNHGGFMEVLDPVGQIKNKSPYTQTCSSFSQSNAKQRFAGGMYCDGFAGNVLATPTTSTLTTPILFPVNGLLRRPQVPTFFNVNGIRYEVDFFSNYTPDVILPTGEQTYKATLNLSPIKLGGLTLGATVVTDLIGGFQPNQTYIPVTFSSPTAVGGSKAQGYVQTNSAGKVYNFVITFPGVGYSTAPTVTIGGAVINNLVISTGGAITSFNIASGGQGYSTGTTITINPIGTTTVNTATAQVTAVNTVTGAITSATIISGGTNWASNISYNVVYGNVSLPVPTPVPGFLDNVPAQIELQTAGNRSMLANDFTQVNDLGYGIFINNGGFAENVSMFTYYNHVSYYSLNGSQIRSTTGSSCYGDYGLRAEGSDPNEVPTAANLSYALTQAVGAYVSSPSYTALLGATTIYVLVDLVNGGFPPYSSGQMEINHHGVIQNYTINAASQILDGSGNPLTSGGKYVYQITFGPVGLIDNVDSTTPIVLRATDVFKLNGFNPAAFSRPATVLTFNDDPTTIYHVTDYSSVQTDNAVFSYTSENYNYITFSTQNQGVNYIPIANSGTLYTTATVTISTTTLSQNVTKTVNGTQGSALSGVQYLALTTSSGTPVVGQVVSGTGITTGTVVTFFNTTTQIVGLSVSTAASVAGGTTLTFTSVRPSASVKINGAGNIAGITVTPGAGWVGTTTTVALTGTTTGVGAIIPTNINIAGNVGSKTLQISNLDAKSAARIANGLAASTPYYYEFGVNGQKFKILAYRSTSVTGQTWAEIDVDQAIAVAIKPGMTLQAGLPSNGSAAITVIISLCRVTGHDFVDVGTGGYATTRIPNDLYGPPIISPDQTKEVIEVGKGRVFYVSTDQDGNFRVGSAFRVDQSQGTVTISAPLDLTNLTSLSLKKDLGPAITQFTIDDTLDGSSPTNQFVPTELAVVNYISRRLGIDQNGNVYAGSPLGPQFLARSGVLPMTGSIDMGTHNIVNLAAPRLSYGTDAVNKNYADTKISNAGTAALDVDGSTHVPNWGVMTGSLQLSNDPFVVTTSATTQAVSGLFTITLATVTGVTLENQVNAPGITPGSYITQIDYVNKVITLNQAIATTITPSTTITIDPVVQAATKRYVDKQSQFNQLRDVSVSTATDTDLVMFAGPIAVSTTTNPAVYNTATRVVNVTNNTAAITNTSSANGGGSDVTLARTGNQVTIKLVGGQGSANPITDYHVNNNAAIQQSKLAMNAATTRASSSGITQANLGLSSFDSSLFAATNGWVTLNLANNLSPTTDIAYNLGSSGFRWGNLFVNTATISSNLNVAGGLVTTNTSFNLLNATATTINFGGAGTAIRIGANTGWTNINNLTTITNTANATTVTNGALNVVGGLGVQKDAYFGGQLYVGGSPVLTYANYTPGGVQQLLAGPNIALNPTSGTGTVTISVTGQLGVPTVIGSANQILVNGSSGSTSTTATFTLSPTLDITVQNLRSVSGGATVYGTWTLASGATFQATYADLAEWYTSDDFYEPGTVLIFGGVAEVTVTAVSNDSRVAGVVTTDPAYVMNAGISTGTAACIALQGRVPVKVIGVVRKGDLLTTSLTPGYATKAMNPTVGTIIGKALADKTDPGMGIIEVAIGRM